MNSVIKYIFMATLIISLYAIYMQFSQIIKIQENQPTNKDLVMVYELCKKKTWSQTNFILKSYWEDETYFKNYLLK